MPENILIDTQGTTTTITFNRPKALNALNAQTLQELEAAIDGLPTGTRALILTGGGEKAFVAGADIAAMLTMSRDEGTAFGELGQRTFRKIEKLPFVTIAAINGFALGGGLELAMSCDLLYASENAKVGLPEVGLGLLPGFGGTQRLARLVGPMLAREMIFTGQHIDAATAKARGIVADVFPAAELMTRVRKIADTISTKGPLAVAACKRIVGDGLDLDIDSGLKLEVQAFGGLFESADRKEGITAFLEKRPAAFTGA
jgi:enoyl-CoA hydratase